jgi:hypothetical protein
VFGAIIAIVGLLVIFCSLGETKLDFSFTIAGIIGVGVGSSFCVVKFKKWIDNL